LHIILLILEQTENKKKTTKTDRAQTEKPQTHACNA